VAMQEAVQSGGFPRLARKAAVRSASSQVATWPEKSRPGANGRARWGQGEERGITIAAKSGRNHCP